MHAFVTMVVGAEVMNVIVDFGPLKHYVFLGWLTSSTFGPTMPTISGFYVAFLGPRHTITDLRLANSGPWAFLLLGCECSKISGKKKGRGEEEWPLKHIFMWFLFQEMFTWSLWHSLSSVCNLDNSLWCLLGIQGFSFAFIFALLIRDVYLKRQKEFYKT